MEARIIAQLRMERSGDGIALFDRDWITAFCGEDFNTGAKSFDLRSADKDHFGRVAVDQTGADGTVDLASVGIAAHGDVECAQRGLRWVRNFFREHDGAGAGTECRFYLDELFQLLKPGVAEDFEESAGLPAGNDESVDRVELLRFADFDDVCAKLLKTFFVSFEIALDGENTDPAAPRPSSGVGRRLFLRGLAHGIACLN